MLLARRRQSARLKTREKTHQVQQVETTDICFETRTAATSTTKEINDEAPKAPHVNKQSQHTQHSDSTHGTFCEKSVDKTLLDHDGLMTPTASSETVFSSGKWKRLYRPTNTTTKSSDHTAEAHLQSTDVHAQDVQKASQTETKHLAS